MITSRATKLESRLRSMEDVKEHSHGEASKRIDERREQQYRRNHAPQEIEDGEHERPHQKSRYQNCPDQCQQCRIFECHDRSMNIASVIRNPGSTLGHWNTIAGTEFVRQSVYLSAWCVIYEMCFHAVTWSQGLTARTDST